MKFSRRSFLSALGGASASIAGATCAPGEGRKLTAASRVNPRREAAYQVRRASAERLLREGPNDDGGVFATGVAAEVSAFLFAKGLPHEDSGEPDTKALKELLEQLRTGSGEKPLRVSLGGTLGLVNPRAAFAYPMIGPDSHSFRVDPAPSNESDHTTFDMLELYWQAILRDVSFVDYPSSDLVAEACSELSRHLPATWHAGTSVGPSSIFREMCSGDTRGPCISQFLYATVPNGVHRQEQRFRAPRRGQDFLTDPGQWLSSQRGVSPSDELQLDSRPTYIRNGRDLAYFVYRDYSFQAFLNAALILSRWGEAFSAATPYYSRSCPFDQLSPRGSTESGFVTYGVPQILDAVTSVANLAMHACWNQKWLVHMRIRPEVYAQRVDATIRKKHDYPVAAALFATEAVDRIGPVSKLLPQAYPDGAPLHPSYPSGHAVIAGACVTVLKAFFREDALFPAPVVPNADGVEVVPFTGESLTVGNELQKLASNITAARNFAGIHYRTDGSAGLLLGESVAVAYLRELVACAPEETEGFMFKGIAGEPVRIEKET